MRILDLIVNDPRLTCYDLRLSRGKHTDEDIAQSLEANDYVSELWIYLEDDNINTTKNTNAWPRVCDALSTRTSLKKVSIHGSKNLGRTQLAILEAIEKNPNIANITVNEVELTEESLSKCLEIGTDDSTAPRRVEFRRCSSPTGVNDAFAVVHGILY